MKILVIQGPNINMLGIREQNIYGAMTMEQIHEQLGNTAKENNVQLDFFQSNLEGEIVDKIQESLGDADAILINPAAYSHTSIAIKDAISAVGLPVVEVHISNIYAREEFRKHSVTAGACVGVLSGFGPFGYHLGLIYLIQVLNETKALQSQNEQSK